MNELTSEAEKTVVNKIISNYDNNGLAFFLALVSAMVFCFASINSDDLLSVWLQIFGIVVLYSMMVKVPVYYIAKKESFNDKSSASLGLTVCFVILTALLIIESDKRDLLYYTGLGITFIFALIMVWRMNMKDSRLNVSKTFMASTVALLVQCVISMIWLSSQAFKHTSKMELQATATTILLSVCIARLLKFLRGREAIESKLAHETEYAQT